MAHEIINSVRGSSIIRCTDVGTANLRLTQFRANARSETVTGLSIKKMTWSTNGAIVITRDEVPIFGLHNAGTMYLDDMGASCSNTASGNISIQIITGGSIVMEVSKTATYNVDPYTGRTI
jgi:hypothetical protein